MQQRWMKHGLWIFFLLALFGVSSCGALGSGNTMTVLAGSELQDIEPLLDEIERETGVRLEFEYIGTLDGTERLMSGADYDLGWFSHAGYLTLLQDKQNVVVRAAEGEVD